MLDGSTGMADTLDPLASNWELFGHVFGWGFDNDIDLDMGLFDSIDSGPVSSTENLSAAWLLCATPRQGSPVEGVKTLESEQRRDPFGRQHDNPWVCPSP